MNLRPYIQPILKWWWMIVAAGLVAGISSFIISKGQPPIYQAHTTLMVGQTINDPNPAQNLFYLEQQLAGIYANTAMRQPIREATMKALDITWLPEYSVIASPNSQLIEIWVNDTNPVRAQAVAAELAHQLILRSPTTNQSADQSRQEFIQKQLNNLQSQIKVTEEEIDKLKSELGNLNSARQIADKQNEIAALENKLSILQANFATLLGNTESGAPNSLTIVEPAELPAIPVGPNKLLTVVMSALIGVGLAVCGAYVIEFFDDTISTSDEVKNIVNAPVLGYIGEMPKDSFFLRYFIDQPQSPVADSFRMLRTKMALGGNSDQSKIILVSSADVSDGKSTVAANLAACVAQVGKRVILLDADLRKPSLHNALSTPNTIGLSDICLGTTKPEDASIQWGNTNVHVILAGTPSPNPVELLESKSMTNILERLKTLADLVVVDCPPMLFTDTLILTSKSDGLLLVVSPGHTRKKLFMKVIEQLKSTKTNLIGMVINRASNKEEYQSRYYSHYKIYSNSPKKNGAEKRFRLSGLVSKVITVGKRFQR